MFAPGSGSRLGVGALLVAFAAVAGLIAPGWIRAAFVALALGLAAVVVFLAWFFRDPERSVGPDIVSAADGRVREIGQEDGRYRISVFMNVTDVHVNRYPLDATVVGISDAGSGFRPAYREDAAHNSRRHYQLDTAIGPVELIQMTGIVARRLVSFSTAGERHAKGDRLGMIVLGSRVDVLLPADRIVPLVLPNQVVRAGVTPIARVRP